MASVPAKIRFTYLDKPVKGDAIRYAFVVAGIDFEDERISYAEVARRREAGLLPFGQVPVIEVDGETHAQSGALLRWAGRIGGLYPDEHMLRIDAVLEVLNELWPELIKIGYRSAMLRHPVTANPMVVLTADQQAEQRELCRDVLFPVRFEQLERMIVKGPYFCGEQVTLADVAFYAMAHQILSGFWTGNGITAAVLDGCPRLQQVADSVHQLPLVASWNASMYG